MPQSLGRIHADALIIIIIMVLFYLFIQYYAVLKEIDALILSLKMLLGFSLRALSSSVVSCYSILIVVSIITNEI